MALPVIDRLTHAINTHDIDEQRGVIIVVVEGDVITRARFYMEPVDAPPAR